VKYVPAWFPGAKFKRQAQEWSIPTAAMVDKPLQYVMENLVLHVFYYCRLASVADFDVGKWCGEPMS
jgi:hypothetical protein